MSPSSESWPGKWFEVSTDFNLLSQVDVVIICVPTPAFLSVNTLRIFSFILSAVRSVTKHLHKDMLVARFRKHHLSGNDRGVDCA